MTNAPTEPSGLVQLGESEVDPTSQPTCDRSTEQPADGNLTCRGRSSVDSTMVDKAIMDVISANQIGMVFRARSDSALTSMKRATATTADAEQAQGTTTSLKVHLPHRLSQSHRMSIGAATFNPKFDLERKRRDGFFDVFGVLGIPMLVFFFSTAAAVLTQAYIQMYPTKFANYLMNTTAYDEGEFWMLPDPEPAPTAVATTLLIALAACYVYFALYMVFFRHRAIVKSSKRDSITSSRTKSSLVGSRGSLTNSSRTDSILGAAHSRLTTKFPELNSSQLLRIIIPALLWPSKNAQTVLTVSGTTASTVDKTGTNVVPVSDTTVVKDDQKLPSATVIPVREIYKQFVNPNGVYHAYYNVLYDAPKLIFQTVALLAYLRKGLPIPLTAFYASLLTVNFLISFYRFQRKRMDRNLIITRLFYLLDLFFAAFAPIVVLAYSYYNFHFDRDVQQTKMDAVSPGIFDRIARLYADPVEISVFRLAFASLRLTTPSTIFTKCALLLLSIIKWRKIITYLIQTNHAKQRELIDHYPQEFKHSNSRRHLLFGMVLFVFFGMGVVMYTTGSILTSKHHCEAYKQHCVVVSYHWIFSDESCPCLVYINRKSDPRTFAEWENPPDAAEELAEVAKMGELKVIQIVNRKLPTLPDPLRECKKLERLTLLYTKTEIVPEWAEELHYLQYFHIEGDFTSSLIKLPHNTFKHMNKLTYLHTGIIPKLTEYPSLDGLTKLQTLAIAAPHSLQELPSFDKLAKLRVLLLVEQASVRRLPSLQPLKSIKQIGVFYRAAMCCNGYLTSGKCNLTNYQCLPRADEPPVQCSNDSISDADAALLSRIGSPLCPNWTWELRETAPSRESTDVACGGVMFRQCQVGNATGMCYNGRMQVVYCDTVGELERMRRLQIERRVGIPCDPSVEAWLGCTESW